LKGLTVQTSAAPHAIVDEKKKKNTKKKPPKKKTPNAIVLILNNIGQSIRHDAADFE